jgi:hypothetical protein
VWGVGGLCKTCVIMNAFQDPALRESGLYLLRSGC